MHGYGWMDGLDIGWVYLYMLHLCMFEEENGLTNPIPDNDNDVGRSIKPAAASVTASRAEMFIHLFGWPSKQ
jgi:hypothetical protein